MATERRPFSLLADSIRSEGYDNNTFSTVVRLMCFMHERWRTNRIEDAAEACEVVIGAGDAQEITGCKRAHIAFQKLSRLPLDAGLRSARATLENGLSGPRVRFVWPKFAEYQRLESRTRANDSPSPETQTQTEIRNPQTPAGAGAVVSPSRPEPERPKRRTRRERQAAAERAWVYHVIPQIRRGVLGPQSRITVQDPRTLRAVGELGGWRVLGEAGAATLGTLKRRFLAGYQDGDVGEPPEAEADDREPDPGDRDVLGAIMRRAAGLEAGESSPLEANGNGHQPAPAASPLGTAEARTPRSVGAHLNAQREPNGKVRES